MRLFSTLPGELISIFKGLGRSADHLNSEAFLIGAYPRSILFKEDCSDIEIVVVGNLEGTVQHFLDTYKMMNNKNFRKKGRMLTIANPYHEKDSISFSQARKESGTGNIKTEQFCRIFSINALAVALNSNDFGNIVDHAGAVNDINNRVLRLLKRETFAENPEYIFKAVSYKLKFNLSMDPMTHSLWKKALKEKYYLKLSKLDIKNALSRIKRLKNSEKELENIKALMEG